MTSNLMLIAKNNKNVLKKVFCLIFALILSIDGFAAVVSDNDGSAFVTKAEFEALKEGFARQINNYNTSIDTKIDGAIASYLAGIKIAKTSVAKTGFDLEGGGDRKINFIGRSNNNFNFSNDIYTSDKIYVATIGTYIANTAIYEQDSYDNWIFHGELTHGNASNFYAVLNNDNTVESFYKDASMKSMRLAFMFSATHNGNGITWYKIKLCLEHPVRLYDANNSYTDDSLQEIYGYGHKRTDSKSGIEDYPNNTNCYVWTYGSNPAGAASIWNTGDTLLLTDMHPQHAMYDDGRARVPQWLKKLTSIQISGTKLDEYGYHFSYQPTLSLRATKQKWNTIGQVKKLNDSRVDYTTNADISYQGGYWGYWAGQLSGKTRAISGYGLKFDQLVNSSGTSTINPNNIYYKQLKKYWDKDIKYSGGFPVYFAENEGQINLKLKSDTAKTIIFSNTQTDAMPTISNSNVLPFSYKLTTSSTWTENVKSLNMAANTTYEMRIDLEKNEMAFANIDVGTGNVKLTQVDDALWIGY